MTNGGAGATGAAVDGNQPLSAKQSPGPLPLANLKVIDVATVFAAPFAATILGDFGADVVKVELPETGDPLRAFGNRKDGVPLWWKVYARNKQAITLDLRAHEDQEVFRDLVREADVLIENFRPGTMEKWNLGADTLQQLNPDLLVLRVSGFGREGAYSNRPGFGTLCEAMSGFAVLNGDPDGPPTVAPMAVGDCIAGLYGAIGVLVALLARSDGKAAGQIIDVSILDAIFSIIGYQCVEYDQLGLVLERTGNRSPHSVPRNVYRTRDGKWVAVSSSTDTLSKRVMRLIGGHRLASDERFSTPTARTANSDELDQIVASWIEARDLADVLAEFERHEAAAAPAYDIEQIFADPHFTEAKTLIDVDDEDLGTMRLPNVVPRLSHTPGSVRFAGRGLGQDTERVLKAQPTPGEGREAVESVDGGSR